MPRPARGGEIINVGLVDDEKKHGVKTFVKVALNDFGGIGTDWRHVSVPLAKFGHRGVFYDAQNRTEAPRRIDWSAITEFKIEVRKGENSAAVNLLFDDIYIRDKVTGAAAATVAQLWEERTDPVTQPPHVSKPVVTEVVALFPKVPVAAPAMYVYGGRSAYRVLDPVASNAAVLAVYLDNKEYSSATIKIASAIPDLGKLRQTTAAGIAFWAKCGPGVSSVFIGLLDDDGRGKKVQTRIALAEAGVVDTGWHYYMIPLRKFPANGLWWSDEKLAEVAGDVAWDRIRELRISVGRYENKTPEEDPIAVYLCDISLIKEVPGWIDSEKHWDAFRSDAPDRALHTFRSGDTSQWSMAHGEKSTVSRTIVPVTEKNIGGGALQISYALFDYCDVICDYTVSKTADSLRDWSRHWGLSFWMYTDKPYQSLTVQIGDAGREVFVANTGCGRGWNQVLVPFKNFVKFPYWQPSDAIQNGNLDLQKMSTLDFKPSGDGSSGTLKIAGVTITNRRTIDKPKARDNVDVVATPVGDSVITAAINPQIFGINAALWDAEMLAEKTVRYVSSVNHGVLRYPGGLRADEDHWREVLNRKDWMIDTDEFLQFLALTHCEGMFTVNFGRGTPQEAADWVRYVNIEKKAGVKYWEIGNELYGDWHPAHCSAEDYGKRSAEFIRAMKAVDPSILVSVVWALDGAWNKTVFEHCKGLCDAVSVHHYPQHTGEESDLALFSAPQTLAGILSSVRRQITGYGQTGREYKIWLSEWNSIDFNPGPQTLTMANGLFVADYLGTLAGQAIDQALYWCIHNSMTPQQGDYGYLSRVGASDGDNVPRPSYFAFAMAADALRDTLLYIKSSDENVRCYLTRQKDGTSTLLAVNTYPVTTVALTVSDRRFRGKAEIRQLDASCGVAGPRVLKADLTKNNAISLPPYSCTVVTVR